VSFGLGCVLAFVVGGKACEDVYSVELGQCYGMKLVSVFPQRSVQFAYHEVEVNVVNAQALQTAVDTLGNAVMPCVVELCGDPDL